MTRSNIGPNINAKTTVGKIVLPIVEAKCWIIHSPDSAYITDVLNSAITVPIIIPTKTEFINLRLILYHALFCSRDFALFFVRVFRYLKRAKTQRTIMTVPIRNAIKRFSDIYYLILTSSFFSAEASKYSRFSGLMRFVIKLFGKVT